MAPNSGWFEIIFAIGSLFCCFGGILAGLLGLGLVLVRAIGTGGGRSQG